MQTSRALGTWLRSAVAWAARRGSPGSELGGSDPADRQRPRVGTRQADGHLTAGQREPLAYLAGARGAGARGLGERTSA